MPVMDATVVVARHAQGRKTVIDATVVVARHDQPRKTVKFASDVSGRELLDIVRVHEDFGLGRIESYQGVTLTRGVSLVPDGSYTFFPKQAGVVAEAATKFWQSLMQLDMPSGATVELPQKPLSLLPFEESSLYVRTVYYKLWSIITSHTDRILITGTPGVGKTSMLLFMLWKLAKTGCDIVLELFSMGPGRILIKGGHLPAAFQTMQSALSEASVEDILQQVGGLSRKGLNHCLTHIIPDGELTGHHVDFASEYVRHALTQRINRPASSGPRV